MAVNLAINSILATRIMSHSITTISIRTISIKNLSILTKSQQAFYCIKKFHRHFFFQMPIEGFEPLILRFKVKCSTTVLQIALEMVIYPIISMTHPHRNFFFLSLFCIFKHVCMAKRAGFWDFLRVNDVLIPMKKLKIKQVLKLRVSAHITLLYIHI
jgi:hypothetical protein